MATNLASTSIRGLMYAFGDVSNPLPESVDLVETMVNDYIVDVTQKALAVATGKKLRADDFLFVIRKDTRKCKRAKELLRLNEELKKARKVFDDPDKAGFAE
eukprot:TRINITY_DN13145_c0_g1_i1.p1 TRINITY_DN13145_c0_g1~~TRINITY_DN13145_c0_g1_i1.p1  ORF type:complete len:102 (-),score=16.38 TRINITY_DN13145_c0_g1_i1:195-500(-)